MHTAFLRGNVVFFFWLSALIVLALACASAAFMPLAHTPCTLNQTNIQRFRQFHRPARGWEHAQGSFHLDADLRPIWNWNTHQLFAFVTAEWEGEKRHTNRVVVWDRIIRTKEEAHLKGVMDMEYTVNDQHAELRGRSLNLTLHYDIMPVVGLLRKATSTCHERLTMPDRYF